MHYAGCVDRNDNFQEYLAKDESKSKSKTVKKKSEDAKMLCHNHEDKVVRKRKIFSLKFITLCILTCIVVPWHVSDPAAFFEHSFPVSSQKQQPEIYTGTDKSIIVDGEKIFIPSYTLHCTCEISNVGESFNAEDGPFL